MARRAPDIEALPSRLIEGSVDCIEVLDLDGRVRSMNEGGMRALEIRDFESVHDASWVDVWQGEHREAARAAVHAARGGGVGRFVGFLPTAESGEPRWWHVVVNAILGPDGKPEVLLAISRDVTEWKRAERGGLRTGRADRVVAFPARGPVGPAPEVDPGSPIPTLHEMERQHILAALARARWVIEGAGGAARILCLHPNTLRSRMKKLGLRRPTRGI